MLTPNLNEKEKNKLASESARIMVTDLILRAILLKLNSEVAHSAMREQILEQMQALKDYWSSEEMLNARSEGFPPGISSELFEHEIDRGFDRVLAIGKQIVDGIFSKPEDVAGQM